MAYSEKVMEHYENPRNIGSLDSGSNRVGSALVGAPAVSYTHLRAHET